MPAHRTPKRGRGGNRVQLNRTFDGLEVPAASDNVESPIDISSSPPTSLRSAAGGSDNVNPAGLEDVSDSVSQEIEKRIEVMRREFQQQMIDMQRALGAQIQQSLRPQVLTVESGTGPSISERTSQSIEHEVPAAIHSVTAVQRAKKIYPLPEFSGSPEEWAIFIEDFECTTREFGYSSLQNIMRLREALKGHARETVEALLSNSANVEDIIETLRETFGRPEQLIRSQIEKVRQISHVVEGDLEGLVTFANKVINMCAFLKNVNGSSHLSNPSLLSELVSKLPIPRQIQWAEKCLTLGKAPTVMDFSSWISAVRKVANIVVDTLPISTQVKLKSNNKIRNVHQSTATTQQCVCCKGECKNLQECSMFLNLSISGRYERVKTLKLCFCCLKKGHTSSRCFSKKQCDRCDKNHNILLHEDAGNNFSNPERRSCLMETFSDGVLFQVVPVNLYANGRKITTYAFVDDGANATIIDKELVRQLGIKGTPDSLELKWLNQQTTREVCEIVKLQISGTYDGAEVYNMSNVYTSESLSLPTQSLQRYDILRERNSLFGQLPVSYYGPVQPRIILSLTHAYLTTPLEAPITSEEPGLIAINTRLGWIVYGSKNNKSKSTSKYSFVVNKITENAEDEMKKMMANYFDMETFGIKNDVKSLVSAEDERSIEILNDTISRKDGRFECGLLWREEFLSFPRSFSMAYKRLLTVEKKMTRDPDYAQKYCDKIEDYIKKGYARKLSTEEIKRTSSKTFHLPHFGVVNANKPGIRLVFDAAAKVNQVSFNDALLSGPDINKSLISILLKFRESPYAVVGDIKEMFHQILAAEDDQQSQRFLWRNGDSSLPVETYVMQRIIFGATCSPTIAQFVKNFNAERFKDQFPRAVEGIVDRHYVDDYVDCFQSENEALKVVGEVIEIHKDGGFELRKLQSNSPKVMARFGEEDSSGIVNVEGNDNRILGMYWSSKSDTFTFILKLNKVNPDILTFEKRPTKRELLCLTMSVFDPYGFLADFMVTAKVLMQNVWKSGIQWDDELPDELYKSWKLWICELQKIETFRIKRCYSNHFKIADAELHVFVDASEHALAAVAYWRINFNNEINVAFVIGKTSCAPTRYHTIPKLELQAAVMGVRLKNLIEKHHTIKIQKVHFWSDSYSVISWIRSDHRQYKQYVANRVSEILGSSKIEQWHWLPGKENPADEATRAKIPPRYNPNGRWKNGPEFLYKNEDFWPHEVEAKDRSIKFNEELRAQYTVLISTQAKFIQPDIKRFSKYTKYKRTMAWVFRYLANLRNKSKNQTMKSGELSCEEETEAELYLIKIAQKDMFKEDYINLQNDKVISKNSPLKTLNPYLENGVVRAKGRIDNAAVLPMSARRPIILSKESPLSLLIVDSYHRKLHHVNFASAITEIRQKFWIFSIRTCLKSVERNCQYCKNRKSCPEVPQMGLLPVDRVTPYVRPFTYCGVDLFGPCNVTIRRRQEKRWVVIFTCLTVRAIHLEVVTNLSTDAFLLALRNFINRRGVPIQFRSDNGTNFVGIKKELKEEFTFVDFDAVTCKLSPIGSKWVFNTPLNPNEGGAWERLIQSVKKVMTIVLKEKSPHLETFQSLLIEAENVVNSRPLTHLPITIDEPEPLTPNHFLMGCMNSTQTPSPYDPKSLCLRKQWRILKSLKDCLWRRWILEYLPDLTRRTKWCLPSNPVAVGSVVYICDPDIARSKWKLGRITQLFYGKDKIARSAEVKTSDSCFKRPLSKLAILDTN